MQTQSEQQRHQSANRLQIGIGQISALAKLGEDLAFLTSFRVDTDMQVHIAKRSRLPNRRYKVTLAGSRVDIACAKN